MVADPEFQARHKSSSQDFSRQSPLGFSEMFWLLCMARPKSMAMEMHEASARGDVLKDKCKPGADVVSGSAFSKRCRRIKTSALQEAHKWFYENWLKSCDGRFLEGGRRLIAVDGTTIWGTPRLQQELESDRRANRTAAEAKVTERYDRPCQFRGIIMHDVLNDVIVDASWDLEDQGERQIAVAVLRRSLRPGDIVVFDRGYPCGWLVKLIRKLGADCIIRMIADPRRQEVEAALAAESDSSQFNWPIGKRDMKSMENAGLEYINGDSASLRCVRGDSAKEKVMLLATTLNEKKFDNNKICEFYRLRWGVEIAIGRLKGIRDIEAWSGRSVHRMELDLWGAILGDAIDIYLSLQGQREVDEAEREREFRRQNPPPNPPPGRPPKPQGTKHKYHLNKLNMKQFHSMIRPIFLDLVMNSQSAEMQLAWQRILQQARRRANWRVVGCAPIRRRTPAGYAAASRRPA